MVLPQKPSVKRQPQPVEDDDDKLPTLKQLVEVGTTRAASSTATAWASAPPAVAAPAQPRPLVVALDVDEVLVQYVDGFRKFMQRERPHGPLDTDSVFHEAHDPSSPWRLQFAVSGGLDNLDAVPGAAAALRRLKRAGIRLEAVTSRPEIMRESTMTLLNQLFPPDTFSDAHFVGGGGKGHACLAIGACALVDDQLPNCIDCSQCGLITVLFDFCGSYPWSKGVTELPPGCKRIETWAETCNFLLLALGVDPLQHSTQPSEYLLGANSQGQSQSENISDEYREILSEAEKQPTEYDPDEGLPPLLVGPSSLQASLLQDAGSHSEPLWRKSEQVGPGTANGGSHSEPLWQQMHEQPGHGIINTPTSHYRDFNAPPSSQNGEQLQMHTNHGFRSPPASYSGEQVALDTGKLEPRDHVAAADVSAEMQYHMQMQQRQQWEQEQQQAQWEEMQRHQAQQAWQASQQQDPWQQQQLNQPDPWQHRRHQQEMQQGSNEYDAGPGYQQADPPWRTSQLAAPQVERRPPTPPPEEERDTSECVVS